MTRRQAIAPVNIGQCRRPAEIWSINRVNTTNRIHCANVYHVKSAESNKNAIVGELVGVEWVWLLDRDACGGLHLTFEEVLLLYVIATKECLLANCNQPHATLVLRAHRMDHAVVFGCVIYLDICHIGLVNIGNVLQQSVLLQVPEGNRTVAVAAHEEETARMNVHGGDPTTVCAGVVHQGHHLFLRFDVENANDALVVADEHEILEEADALADPIELVALCLELPCDLVIFFV